MEEKDLTLDYIHGTDIYVYQRKDMFRMNTDTAQLARFLNVKKGERVLDVGCNNGALLLYAAQFKPSFLCGVDIQKEACEIADFNMQQNKIENVEIIHCDFEQFHQSGYDVVICNPPFFASQHQLDLKRTMRTIARHEYNLTLNVLMQNIAHSLKEGGRLYMVHRADRIADIIELGRTNHLEIKQLQFVYDKRKNEAGTVLLKAMKGASSQCRVLAPIYL